MAGVDCATQVMATTIASLPALPLQYIWNQTSNFNHNSYFSVSLIKLQEGCLKYIFDLTLTSVRNYKTKHI